MKDERFKELSCAADAAQCVLREAGFDYCVILAVCREDLEDDEVCHMYRRGFGDSYARAGLLAMERVHAQIVIEPAEVTLKEEDE